MRNKFKGYYKPNTDDLNKLWDDCVFIFDTNVLFDFYRYSSDTVEVLFAIFEKLKDRIWIPHRVGLEYHRGLEDRIKEQVEKYTSTIKDLSNFSNKIKSQREHPFLSDELQKEIKDFHEKFEKELTSQKSRLKDLITDNPVKEKLAEMIGENIGDELSEEDQKKIIEEGDKRLPQNVPPGFVDYKEKSKRPGLDKYGDYIIWFEILKEFKNRKKPVIFVTFDTKEDWYKQIKFNNSKILVGPQPELIEEFFNESENTFWLYPTKEFIDCAVKHFKIEVEEEKLKKAREETTQLSEIEIDEDSISEMQNQAESPELNQYSIGQTSSSESSSTEGYENSGEK